MTKVRISASIKEETWHKIRKAMRNTSYTSKSHLIEEAILRLVEASDGE